MDNKQKRKVAGGAVYVFCAFMLVSILTVAMLTAISERKTDRNTLIPADTKEAADTGTPAVRDEPDRVEDWERTPGTKKPDSSHNIVNGTEPADQTAAIPYAYAVPVDGEVSKSYNDQLAVWSSTMNDYRAHLGVDIEAEEGTPVSAFADGVITAMWDDPFMGTSICVEHGGGMKSFYMNLSSEHPDGISPGVKVACGQTIGAVGRTARAEADDPAHLHFEVTVNGAHADPADYVDVGKENYEDEEG